MQGYDIVEETYKNFWKDIICDENGEVNIEQVKKELCDFYKIIQEVPKVYSEVTGGLLSKPLYDAGTVISVFNERFGDKAYAVDYLADDWADITVDCQTNEDYKKSIFNYLGIKEN